MSFFSAASPDKQKELIFTIGTLFLFFGGLAFAVLWYVDLPRMALLYNYLPWLFCFLVLGTIASLSEHILIVKQKARTLFYYGFISYSSYFIGLAILIYTTRAIQPLFIGLAIWALFRFGYFLLLCIRESKARINFNLLVRFLVFGTPLILHVLLGGGMEYIDGFIVERFFERSEFTYFRYGARELPINTIFISALASAFIPLAVINLPNSLEQIKLRTNKLMNYLFPLSIVLMMISPFLFESIYSSEYIISAQIFNIYLLILCSRILLPQIVVYGKQKNSVLMVVSIIEFIINLGLSLYWMESYGLYGIAFATVVAFFIQKLILVIYIWMVMQIPLKDYLNIPKYSIYTLALYATFYLSFILFQ